MPQPLLVLLHILGATIWTGGHLVLAITVLPRALKAKDPAIVHDFEETFERLAVPALIMQIITGVWLAYRQVPDIGSWFVPDDPTAELIATKLGILAVTLILALDARLRLIPKLTSDRLVALTWHIVPVTILSVLFVFVGVWLQYRLPLW